MRLPFRASFSRYQVDALHRATFACLVVALLVGVCCGRSYGQAAGRLVISQIYGSGGNMGASYNADYVEIFNPTTTTISLAGYSIQYASATGTSISADIPLSSVSLVPGQHYLLSAIPGSVGTYLNADQTSGLLVLSGTAGKVYLVSSTNAISPTCPATTIYGVVDFIGYGATASCSYTAPAPAPSATNADIRTNPCIATFNNSTEYTASPANPRNTSSPLTPCVIVATGAATPSTLNAGATTLLTVQVSSPSGVTSTGISVTADLSALSAGGSTSQQFYDDGVTGGDVTAGDKIFSYTTTVTNVGSFSIPVTVTDSQLHSAKTAIALTAVQPPPGVSIRMIQSAKPSTYVGQKVTTSGIVIGVEARGFFLEAKDADTTPSTPEGIFIFSSSAPPSYVVPGAEVQVSGTVTTYPGATVSKTPDTELDSVTDITLISSNNPLPTPVKITAALDSPSGGIYQFTKYEGMRVSIDSLTATSGTAATINEQTETATSLGLFYGVVSGVARPFREPGISVTDLKYGTPPTTIPVFDSDPELLTIDSLIFSNTGVPAPLDVTTGATLTSVVGVMDFSTGAPVIDLDAAARPTISGLTSAEPVPVRTNNEFTVGSIEMYRFYTSDATAAKNAGSTVTVLTTEAYQRRLKKTSLTIRNVLNIPDILALQEVQDLAVMQDIANQVSLDAKAAGQTDPAYTPYLFLATDPGGLNTGFLVRTSRVTVSKAEQLGLNATYADASGNPVILNDHTPIVLHAGIKRGTAADYPVTVINVHLRSLFNVDDPTDVGKTARLQREAQAEYLASLIQSYQAGGEHVITVGNFNAYQFSDGFVDSLGVIEGAPVPSSQVVTPPVAGLVNPTLLNASTYLPRAQQKSYLSLGIAALLDHVVVTRDIVPTRLVYARIGADYPGVYLNDPTRPEAEEFHDPLVAYFAIPAASGGGTPSTPVITWAPSSTTGFKGVAIGAGVLDATSTTLGTFTYTATPLGGSAVAITSSTTLGVGSYTLTANFAPADTANYTAASATVGFTVVNQQIFVVNSGGSVTSINRDGSVQSGPASGGGRGAAVDANGAVWSIQASGGGVAKFAASGTAAATYTDATITGATALAVDGDGRIWVADSNAITALSNNGSPLFSNAVATSSGLNSPSSLQIDTAGSIWLASPASNTVVEVIGAASPVIAPTVSAVISGTPGSKP